MNETALNETPLNETVSVEDTLIESGRTLPLSVEEEAIEASEIDNREIEDPEGASQSLRMTFTNSLGMEFQLIQPGQFQMGSDTGSKDETPVHTVVLSGPMYMGITEVTQEQWEAIMGNNPSRGHKSSRPFVRKYTGDARRFV